MSKLSFRARALDASKPMPVYQKDELSDLQDYSVLNRAVPQMPSGMEKEEESEHHLQRAISAQQVYGDAKVMVIPVPEAEVSLACYNNLYKKPFRLPKHYIHNQAQALNSILEQEKPDYDMDSEDEKWLKEAKKRMGLEMSSDQFEEMIDRLEKSCGKQMVTLQEAKLLLKEDDDLIKAVYDYWTKKRVRNKRALLLQVRHERRDGSSSNDCYVAFRRRTEKMQTRKNRKNDESSYEKMLKLRRELSRAVTILEMIKRREKSKRELLHLTLEVFEKRYQMRDWDGKCLRSVRKELHSQRARLPFRPIGGAGAQFRKKRLYNAVAKSKPTINNVPSISRGELNRDDLPKKAKKKWQRLPLTVGGTSSSSYLQSSKSSSDWLNAPNKTTVGTTHLPPVAPPSSKSPSLSYQDVVDTMTQYEFPTSDNEDTTSPISSTLPSDGFDPKKHPDGIFTFRRKPGCSYYAPRDNLVGDWPWHTDASPRHRYSLTSLSVPDKCIGFARRRIGRGGRILLDRAHHPYQRQLEQLDLKKEHVHQPPTLELQAVLAEIKKNRWRHYEATKKTVSSKTSSSSTFSQHLEFTDNFPFSVADTKRTTYLHSNAPSKPRKPSSKKAFANSQLELSKSSVAFAMSALVTVATSTPVTLTTTTNCSKVPRTTSNVSHCKVVSKTPVPTTRKCVACGGMINLTSTFIDSKSTIGLSSTTTVGSSNPSQHRVVPLTLSLATSGQQVAPQRNAVLPATVNVSNTRAVGGSHGTGVPAVLRISNSGTVLYPQPPGNYIKTDDLTSTFKPKKEVLSMSTTATSHVGQARRTFTQRTSRGPVNVNLAIPANVLASISSDGSALRATHSAPNSPRSQQATSGEAGTSGKVVSGSNNSKTISLNLSQLNASQGSLFMTNSYANSGQVVNAGRLTIAGNMLKLGNTLLHVALPQTTRQSTATSSGAQASGSSENTLLVNEGNLILATMDENKQKRTKNLNEQIAHNSELMPMTLSALHSTKKGPLSTAEDGSNHSVQISGSSSSRVEPGASTSQVEPLSTVTTNTVSVKSSKATRPMEVT